MNITLQKGQRWTCKADGLVHRVLEISSADGVATWSEPLPEALATKGVAGYSWLGPVADFLRQFVPAPPLPPSTSQTLTA